MVLLVQASKHHDRKRQNELPKREWPVRDAPRTVPIVVMRALKIKTRVPSAA